MEYTPLNNHFGHVGSIKISSRVARERDPDFIAHIIVHEFGHYAYWKSLENTFLLPYEATKQYLMKSEYSYRNDVNIWPPPAQEPSRATKRKRWCSVRFGLVSLWLVSAICMSCAPGCQRSMTGKGSLSEFTRSRSTEQWGPLTPQEQRSRFGIRTSLRTGARPFASRADRARRRRSPSEWRLSNWPARPSFRVQYNGLCYWSNEPAAPSGPYIAVGGEIEVLEVTGSEMRVRVSLIFEDGKRMAGSLNVLLCHFIDGGPGSLPEHHSRDNNYRTPMPTRRVH